METIRFAAATHLMGVDSELEAYLALDVFLDNRVHGEFSQRVGPHDLCADFLKFDLKTVNDLKMAAELEKAWGDDHPVAIALLAGIIAASIVAASFIAASIAASRRGFGSQLRRSTRSP